MIAFERSSPEARAYLRERRASYAAADGELFVYAPPVFVERPPRRKVVPVGAAPAAPFANRASRVPRWLLLHATDQPSFRELATRLELSEAMVSRTMRALADDGLVAIGSDPRDARLRLARLPEPARLLDAFERAVALRRPRRVTWEIGARDAPEAMKALQTAAHKLNVPYAVGGVAGASFVRPAVEPVDVVVWIRRDDADLWAERARGYAVQAGTWSGHDAADSRSVRPVTGRRPRRDPGRRSGAALSRLSIGGRTRP